MLRHWILLWAHNLATECKSIFNQTEIECVLIAQCPFTTIVIAVAVCVSHAILQRESRDVSFAKADDCLSQRVGKVSLSLK